jgi:hypothetical protein
VTWSSAIGRRAIGSLDPAVARGTDPPWKPAFGGTDAAPVIVVEFGTWSLEGEGGLIVRRYGTHGFVTGAYDDPPNTVIEPRCLPRVTLDVAAPVRSGGLLGGAAGRSIGAVALANGDGGLDWLLDHATDGRRVRLLYGEYLQQGATTEERGPSGPVQITVDRPRVAPFSTFETLLVATGDAWSGDLRELELGLQDTSAMLRVPVQPRLYRGTGGREGPPDLADRPRPLCYGRCYQVPPVLVDPPNLIYQVHDGKIAWIEAVYDAGVKLEPGGVIEGGYDQLAAATVEPGSYVSAPAAGMFRLGSPPAGVVTVDLRGAIVSAVQGYEYPWGDGRWWADGRGWVGHIPGPGYVETPGSIVLALLAQSGLPRDLIAVESLLDVDVNCPWPCGLFIGPDDRATVEQAIDRVIGPLAVVAAPDRLGRYRAAALVPQPTKPRRIINEASILSIEQRPLPWRTSPRAIVVGHTRYWRTQSPTELATSVPLERRTELGRPYRTTRVEVPDAAVLHPPARETDVIETVLATAQGAAELGQRLAAVHGPRVRRLVLRVRGLALVDLGDAVTVQHPRYGLEEGEAALVIGLRTEVQSITTVLDVIVGVGQ